MTWRILLNGLQCSEPRSLDVSDPLVDELPLWQRANSYTCPRGKTPGSAYLLIQRAKLDTLDANATDHTITFESSIETVVFQNMVIVRALSMYGLPQDGRSPMLVELRDRREIMRRATVAKGYNVTMPAPSQPATAARYYPETLNGGAAWTWNEMVGDLWGFLTDAGGPPSLPYAPASTPESLRFYGVSAWESLHVVLRQLGCETAYDPILDTFSLVRLSDTQQGLVTSKAALRNRLRQDFDPPDTFNAGNLPETVRVFFPRKERWHGIELDTPQAGNWENLNLFAVDIATGIAGAKGVLGLTGDLYALQDKDGTGAVTPPENLAELQVRAQEMADNVHSPNRMRQMYVAAISVIVPGEEVSTVIWRDYEGGPLPSDPDGAIGMVTEVIHSTEEQSTPFDSSAASQSVQPNDLARKSHPVYPDLLQVVQVFDTGGDPQPVDAVLPGAAPVPITVFPGNVRLIRDGLEILDRCWITPLDDFDRLAGNKQLLQGVNYHGRLSGTARSDGGDERPLYSVVASAALGGLERFRLTENLARNGQAAAVLLDSAGNPGLAVIVFDSVMVWHGLIGYEGWCVRMADQPDQGGVQVYEIVNMEGIVRHVEFTLDSTFTSGVATATITGEWGNAPNGKPFGGTIQVVDSRDLWTRAMIGARGYAVYDDSTVDPAIPPIGTYRVEVCEQPAINATAVLTTKLCPQDSTAEVSTILGIDPWPFTQEPDVLEVGSPGNRFVLAAIVDAEVLLKFNRAAGAWFVVQVQHQAMEMVVDVCEAGPINP